MLRALTLSLANLEEEFELLGGIIILLLLDAAVDHTIERLQVRLVLLGSALVSLVGLLVFSLKATLVASFGLV